MMFAAHTNAGTSGRPFEKRDYYALLALCALCLVLFFFRLGGHPLWDVDEGMHASTSKDMVQTGDWVTPQFNGKNFYDKTVLYNWFAAVAFLVFGFTEFAARVPAALLGLGTVLTTFLLGRRLLGSRAGLLAGVILATSPEFIVLSRAVVHDISLAFFVTLALSFFYRAYASVDRRGTYLMLFYASLGMAVLAKGPVGLLLPGMVIGLFLLIRGRLGFLKEMSLGWGILVFLAVAAPWYVLMSIRNDDYLRYFVLKQNLGQFLSKAKANHPQPFYYYVPTLVGGMLPWSFFVPLALFRSLRQGLRKLSDGVLFPLLWFAFIFLFFSAARSKLATYVLPCFPAVALLVAGVWNELLSDPTAGRRRSAVWSLAPLPVLFLAATVFVVLKHPVLEQMEFPYGIGLRDIAPILIIVTVLSTAALLFLLSQRYRAAFAALAATLSIGFLVALVTILPLVDPYRSTVKLAKEMDRMLPPGEKMTFFWNISDTALFYTDRKATLIWTEQDLLRYLASDGTPLCVIDSRQYEKFPRVAAASSIIDREGRKLLITRRQPQATGPQGGEP